MRHVVLIFLVGSLLVVQHPIFAALQLTEAQKVAMHTLFIEEPAQSNWSWMVAYLPQAERTDLQIDTAQLTYQGIAARAKQVIPQMHQANVVRLEKQYAAIQRKYAPLLLHYKSLSVQYSSLPTKSATELRKVIRSQMNAIRPAVYLARASIANARVRLQTERKLRVTAMTSARKKWAAVQSRHRTFTLIKTRIHMQESHLRTEWKSLLKQKDRSYGTVSLRTCKRYAEQLAEMKMNYLTQLNNLNALANELLKQF